MTDALIAFGYLAQDIDVLSVKQDDGTRSVDLGVTFQDGCLSGGCGCIPPELYPPT